MLLGKYEKIQNAIPSDADGILLTSEISQYYATGFELQDGYVLITKDKTYLLCDFRYTEAAKEHCKDCAAKYYCGGGCAANAKNFAGKIEGQFEQACILTRKRLENSLAIAYIERTGK